jgi:hypothetical protein
MCHVSKGTIFTAQIQGLGAQQGSVQRCFFVRVICQLTPEAQPRGVSAIMPFSISCILKGKQMCSVNRTKKSRLSILKLAFSDLKLWLLQDLVGDLAMLGRHLDRGYWCDCIL